MNKFGVWSCEFGQATVNLMQLAVGNLLYQWTNDQWTS